MRKNIIAGNWKMNTDVRSGAELLDGIIQRMHGVVLPDTTEVVVCPPFTHLAMAQAWLLDGPIKLGAQTMHNQPSGAFTGAISAVMLRSVGCQYVIIGHSERRLIFGESDYYICKCVGAALENKLTPILCVGETISEREQGTAMKVVENQLLTGLEDIGELNATRCVVAYEPVWAIGTGNTATPEQAQEMHAFIRSTLAGMYTRQIADDIPILYGGSVNAENAAILFAQPDIDGGLIGGASLKADSFVTIVRAVKS